MKTTEYEMAKANLSLRGAPLITGAEIYAIATERKQMTELATILLSQKGKRIGAGWYQHSRSLAIKIEYHEQASVWCLDCSAGRLPEVKMDRLLACFPSLEDAIEFSTLLAPNVTLSGFELERHPLRK